MFESALNYDNENLLDKLKRLSAVHTIKDIKNITHTQFPGKHCPLTGALLVSRGIKDSLALIVGTDECVYYSKSMTIGFTGYGGLHGRCVSVRLDTNDVTFGSVEKIEAAFDELLEEYKPSCVFLISTCLIEIIGDDFDALADQLTKKYKLPVLPVHTEHFKCIDHMPGIERALASCVYLMKKQEQTNSVNILGQRHGEFDTTELSRVLKEADIEINMQLPKECTIDIVNVAPKAKMNIVVNDTAHVLAQRMEEEFGIPYVIFYKSASADTNYNAYQQIFKTFNMSFPQAIEEQYKELKQRFEAMKNVLKGLTYIYGSAPFAPFEHNRLLCELGLVPLLLQLSDVDEYDEADIQAILEKHDPLVARIPNTPAMMRVYKILNPDFGIGVGNPAMAKELNVVPVRHENSYDMLGLEMAELFLESIEKAQNVYKQFKEGK